jgi:hypothetical protein
VSQRTNLYVDMAILVGFMVAYEPALTGVAVHEWLSLAFASALIVHLLLHWDWIVQVTLKFFRKLFHSSRLNYVLNLALLVDFVLILLSGLLISRSVLPTLGIQVASNPAWRFLHSSAADFSLLLLGLHLALQWKWILSTTKRYLFSPRKRSAQPQALQPVVVSLRREKE